MKNLTFFATAAFMLSPAFACMPLPLPGEMNKKVQAVQEKIVQKKPLSEEEKQYWESYKKDVALVNDLRAKSPTECGQPTPQDEYNKQINALYKKWENN